MTKTSPVFLQLQTELTFVLLLYLHLYSVSLQCHDKWCIFIVLSWAL